MKCANDLCIYCKDEKCILERISINELGMCDDAIQIVINPELLMQEKQKQLQEVLELQ